MKKQSFVVRHWSLAEKHVVGRRLSVVSQPAASGRIVLPKTEDRRRFC
jgi:hypothetical protein